jgi:hypothetical protein
MTLFVWVCGMILLAIAWRAFDDWRDTRNGGARAKARAFKAANRE